MHRKVQAVAPTRRGKEAPKFAGFDTRTGSHVRKHDPGSQRSCEVADAILCGDCVRVDKMRRVSAERVDTHNLSLVVLPAAKYTLCLPVTL